MDRDLKPIRIKVGQAFSVPVSYIGEPAPECIWTVKGMVGVELVFSSKKNEKFILKHTFSQKIIANI